MPEFLSEKCSEFLLRILNTNPERRIKIREIKRHAWMNPTKNLRIK